MQANAIRLTQASLYLLTGLGTVLVCSFGVSDGPQWHDTVRWWPWHIGRFTVHHFQFYLSWE